MTRDEIISRIEELEMEVFLIEWKDRLFQSDWNQIHECEREIKKLRELLKGMED